jgi:hypothetical protein
MSVLECYTQISHRSNGVGALDIFTFREVLRLPDPTSVLVTGKTMESIPCNPKEADNEQRDA